ncbi:hypothetical protein AB0F72_01265 [Actinoplanes sp. NPDC023936]|uniref:hypothetical protein n=1 Tax=Actinoplanes sp. NPDC023936 TaxID=3154910 RepID=UPI00340DF862
MRIAVIGAAATLAFLAGAGPAMAAAPRPSNPVGATVSLAATSVAAGKTLRFSGTGFVNDGGRGQIVTIKLDDVDILRSVTASDSGAISGTVTIPKATTAGNEHWLRFLAGSGRENDSPSRSLASGYFAVTAASTGSAATTGGSTAAPTTAGGTTAGGTTAGGTTAGGTTAGGTAETLPKTGIDAGPWLAGTVALPVVGIALLLVERRRRARNPS